MHDISMVVTWPHAYFPPVPFFYSVLCFVVWIDDICWKKKNRKAVHLFIVDQSLHCLQAAFHLKIHTVLARRCTNQCELGESMFIVALVQFVESRWAGPFSLYFRAFSCDTANNNRTSEIHLSWLVNSCYGIIPAGVDPKVGCFSLHKFPHASSTSKREPYKFK